jgi:hypothetical protein
MELRQDLQMEKKRVHPRAI